MKALLLTNEYPPHVYGGAGVHVDYLSRALARLMEVEVRCFGRQEESEGNLKVSGFGVDSVWMNITIHSLATARVHKDYNQCII